MFTIMQNIFTREQIVELAKLFGHPRRMGSLIDFGEDIKSLKEFEKILHANRIDKFEIVGTWGDSMVWSMGRNHEWSNSAGIITVTW